MPRIYSVHDTKSEAYLSPWYAKTKGEAIRAFSQECANPDSPFHKFASDFTLYELGDFDELTANICTHDKPLHLANASEFKQ